MSPYSPRDADRQWSASSRPAASRVDPFRAALERDLADWNRARAAQEAASAPVTAPPPAEAPTDPVDVSAALRALAPDPDAAWGSVLDAIVQTAPAAETPASGVSALNYGGAILQDADALGAIHSTSTTS